jgi:hypothetical protein
VRHEAADSEGRRRTALHSFTKTGWCLCLCLCLCLRGIVALLLQWTCLADRVRGARRPGVSVLAERTSRDPGRRWQGIFTRSARGCSRSSSSGGSVARRLGAECAVGGTRQVCGLVQYQAVAGEQAAAERRVKRAAARERCRAAVA